MSAISAELAQFLADILADEEPPSLSSAEDDSDPDDDSDQGLSPRRIWYFPSDETYQEYLSSIDNQPEGEVQRVIQRLLIPSGAFGADRMTLNAYIAIRDRCEENAAQEQWRLEWINSNYVQRVVRYFGHMTDDLPWEGITWVIDLLPDRPRTALDALDAYLHAHTYMTENMVGAISDAEGIIRARYIGLPESAGQRLAVLSEITWREFERLVEHLYHQMGYKTELTQATRDGGRDIIAEMSGPGMQERILVSCKQSSKKVVVSAVRELDSVTTREFANKGALVTNSDFTAPARTEFSGNSRIELINGTELVILLNEHLGWTWPVRIENLTRKRPFRVARRQ